MLLLGGHFFCATAGQCASSEGWACSARPGRGALAVARNAARSTAIAIGLTWVSPATQQQREQERLRRPEGILRSDRLCGNVLLHAALHNRESRSARFARSLIVSMIRRQLPIVLARRRPNFRSRPGMPDDANSFGSSAWRAVFLRRDGDFVVDWRSERAACAAPATGARANWRRRI
jgi:hypothetical protein